MSNGRREHLRHQRQRVAHQVQSLLRTVKGGANGDTAADALLWAVGEYIAGQPAARQLELVELLQDHVNNAIERKVTHQITVERAKS